MGRTVDYCTSQHYLQAGNDSRRFGLHGDDFLTDGNGNPAGPIDVPIKRMRMSPLFSTKRFGTEPPSEFSDSHAPAADAFNQSLKLLKTDHFDLGNGE